MDYPYLDALQTGYVLGLWAGSSLTFQHCAESVFGVE